GTIRYTEKVFASGSTCIESSGIPADTQQLLAYIEQHGIKTSRDVKYEPIYGREKLPGERMGIMSYVVKKLFDKRVPIKAEFVRLSKLSEQMEKDELSQ